MSILTGRKKTFLPVKSVFLSPDLLSPFLVCRLIALDKNPGVRPIGVCEVMRRIVAKAVLVILRDDIQEAAGSHQLCAGQLSGAEAAVHAVRRVFEEGSTEAVLLVDASNAFNSLNRLVALHNIRQLCPPLSTILINIIGLQPLCLFLGRLFYQRRVLHRETH